MSSLSDEEKQMIEDYVVSLPNGDTLLENLLERQQYIHPNAALSTLLDNVYNSIFIRAQEQQLNATPIATTAGDVTTHASALPSFSSFLQPFNYASAHGPGMIAGPVAGSVAAPMASLGAGLGAGLRSSPGTVPAANTPSSVYYDSDSTVILTPETPQSTDSSSPPLQPLLPLPPPAPAVAPILNQAAFVPRPVRYIHPHLMVDDYPRAPLNAVPRGVNPDMVYMSPGGRIYYDTVAMRPPNFQQPPRSYILPGMSRLPDPDPQ